MVTAPVPGWVHSTSSYLRAALAVGLQVRRCEEPVYTADLVDETGTPPGDDNEPAERYLACEDPPDIWANEGDMISAKQLAMPMAENFIVYPSKW